MFSNSGDCVFGEVPDMNNPINSIVFLFTCRVIAACVSCLLVSVYTKQNDVMVPGFPFVLFDLFAAELGCSKRFSWPRELFP